MAKVRHVVLAEKTLGDEAMLSPSTMQELGLADQDSLTITSLTYHQVLPAVGRKTVGHNQIRLPKKAATSLREGERLTIQQTPEAHEVEPEPRPSHPVSRVPTKFEWDDISSASFDEIAGLDALKARIEQALYYLTHPEWFLIRKGLPPRVFLFFGPYGCGKTMMAKAMAGRLSQGIEGGNELDVKLKSIRPSDIKDPYLGMSAKKAQAYLDAAREECNRGSTVLLLLDEIDSLVSDRADRNSHEEYRDVVNSIIQDVQGVHELEAESRIRKLWSDPEVDEVRKQLATTVRKKGRRDHRGDISLHKEDWGAEVQAKMLRLRQRVVETGGVSTVIIVGTSNDPTRVDEAFLSRAGDNIFFVPRPSAEAIEQMLRQQLDHTFVDLDDPGRTQLAHEAFEQSLTGRDIMLSWLQPLRTMRPGALTITGFQTIRSYRPHPTVGIEWERDLHQRLRGRGQVFLAEQVSEYLLEVEQARAVPSSAVAGKPGSKANGKQPALL